MIFFSLNVIYLELPRLGKIQAARAKATQKCEKFRPTHDLLQGQNSGRNTVVEKVRFDRKKRELWAKGFQWNDVE